MANNPYVNKIQYGNQTLVDLTSDTIVANKLASGKTAHDASGNQITGTYDFATATAANAIASDVTEGKTGWANGVQIIGTKKGVPTWADGTDAEIAEALTRHYNNEIDLNDYWTVGDERVVHLSAINGSDYSLENQVAQDVTFVILNVGGKELVTPINGHTECAFIVGQKDSLSTKGKLNPSDITQGYSYSQRASWCNNEYKNAIPSTLRGIFKEHYNYICVTYSSIISVKGSFFFILPALNEVTGESNTYDKSASQNPQLDYYKSASNRIKKVDGTNAQYWTSSKYYTNSASSSTRKRMFCINAAGTGANSLISTEYGIAPQGVI